ncbi:predicted protein [Naegleria gruberi]|uniref:Predicted protein n=1 Tax=Naegleria gruberi TaxID=5762 RepID=D2VS41_NAEGR|nr:uncharacterized protein NAEGRDRAFT_71804 [Naegleria gruberi]EFC40358.1 predicted protein [Naegleria gruberi]|eukprot:XP_002673102.1 predicted protein [Naegleria gruberi strain NEG-M]
MGDLFDNGRRITDEEYGRELKRFRKTFENRDGIKTIYLSGNHDIGLENWEKKILDRFEKHFMPLNFNYAINSKMNIIGVNSMYLGTPIYDFLLKNVDAENSKNILLTHIPLYRDGLCQNDDFDTRMGTKSRSRPLEEGYGAGYRNMLNPSDSKKLVSLTKPILVLSGDDHEYCKFQHNVYEHTVTEHTIPTFSMLQGTFKYGYGILTLDMERNSVHDLSIYYLPKIWNIFIFYAILFIIATIYSIFKFKSVLSYLSILTVCLLTYVLCQVWWWIL